MNAVEHKNDIITTIDIKQEKITEMGRDTFSRPF